MRWLRDRLRTRAYLHGTAIRKLNLGCGRHPLPDWLNTDLRPKSGGVVRLDAARRFPFGSGLFAYVYSEHMIEHLPYERGVRMLAECHRVLAAGGKLRIVTPDLAFLFALHGGELSDLQRRYVEWATRNHVRWAPRPEPVFVINNFFRDWGHQLIHDESSLRRALEDVGFEDVVRVPLGESGDPVLRGLENEERMPEGFLALESLVLEAVRG